MKNIRIGKLEIFTTIMIIINILIYELGFCNLNNIKNGTYTFSLFRIVVYIVFFVLYILSIKKFSLEARKTLQSKKKVIIGYFVAFIIYLIYKFITRDDDYNIIMTLIAGINLFIFILYISKDYIKNIVITIVTLGTLMSIFINVFHRIDEKKHFLSAFNVAIGKFDLKNGYENDEFDNIAIFFNPSQSFAKDYFNKYSTFMVSKIDENKSIYSTPAEYIPMLYIPASIGINIARLLGGSIADIFFAGRIANLIFYGILLIIIFEILPFKKKIFYVIYLLPMILALAGTYSIDGITLGFVGIFIAYVLKLYNEKRDINLKELICLSILFILSLLGKNGSYIGIGLLILMLPIFKSLKVDKKVRYIAISIALIVFLTVGFQAIKVLQTQDGDIRGGDNTSPARQVQYLKENPTDLFLIYIKFFKELFFNLESYISLNSFIFFFKESKYITILLILFIFYTTLTDESDKFDRKSKILMFLSSIITIFTMSFVMYLSFSPIGNDEISGFQSRYILPVLPLMLMCVNSKKITVKKDEEDETYNKTVLYYGLITFLDILAMIV